ncbi:TadE/TadG family type IV pilus assembly protein [Methylobacterium trifolii]|uniref:Pilus assembly protein n=1 Tax=Methylobacterium trifolii TaxID=1003092 RepID=A0ABQ4TX74_9HYPH|nr:TadE/TadG family type IV pilus assembly protein [Methylobacterium trifolii]GJE59860.1 hypothetical protein MPOCJGCO_1962 [Methylobacterium trifolii]
MALRPLRRGFARDAGGGAIVEFAFLATILLACTAGAVDVISISGFNREIERTTKQVAGLVTSCPSSATAGYGSCITDTIQQYTARKANTLIRYPTMALSIVQVNEISGAIRVCTGTATYLESDVQTKALAVLSEKDLAVVVVMSMTYTPLFSAISQIFTGSTTSTLRGYTIAVQASNTVAC